MKRSQRKLLSGNYCVRLTLRHMLFKCLFIASCCGCCVFCAIYSFVVRSLFMYQWFGTEVCLSFFTQIRYHSPRALVYALKICVELISRLYSSGSNLTTSCDLLGAPSEASYGQLFILRSCLYTCGPDPQNSSKDMIPQIDCGLTSSN